MYIFDNYSSFQVEYNGILFPTSEHAYQAMKFIKTNPGIFEKIKSAKSAHDAHKIAISYKSFRDTAWNEKKRSVMKNILRHKIRQHPYVLKKLIQSGTREIIEDSWRDAIWGWGENKDGKYFRKTLDGIKR
ncbi:MAG: NADAR family protein [Nanobdellota archaeon]